MSKNRSLNTDLNEIVTPNRLLLGRNNQRSPTFVAEFETGLQQYDERLLRNSTINHTWYELLLKMVPDLVFRPKWFDNTIHKPKYFSGITKAPWDQNTMCGESGWLSESKSLSALPPRSTVSPTNVPFVGTIWTLRTGLSRGMRPIEVVENWFCS